MSKLVKVKKGFCFFIFLMNAVMFCGTAVGSSSNDDYLQLDKKMEQNKKTNSGEKKVVLVEDDLSKEEREMLRQSASDNELVKGEAIQKLREIERQKEEIARMEEENKKIVKKEEYEIKVRELEVEKEKLLLKEKELEEYNARMAEQEQKIAEQQRKILEEQRAAAAKQEELQLQNLQKERELLRQEAIKQEALKKELEVQQIAEQRRMAEEEKVKKRLEQQLLKKEKELEKERKRVEELTKKSENAEDLKDVVTQNNEELKVVVTQNNEELREEIKKQIDVLREEQGKKLQELKISSGMRPLGRTGVVKSTNYSDSIYIIDRIENNLTHSVKRNENSRDAFISIKKGAWADEDLIEVEESDLETKKTSKKQEASSVLTKKAEEIKDLKDKAYTAVQMGEYEVGILYYKRILEKDKTDNFAKLSLATTYHTLGQYRQAKPLYVELIDVFPNSEQLMSNLLSIMIQETPYEAVYLIPSVAERHEKSSIIQAQMSVAYASVGKYPEAIKYMQKALYLEPNNIDYKYNLAVFFDLNKNYKEAKKIYNEVLVTDASNRIRNSDIKKRLLKI
ncbi:MAG: hypothetical protein LBG48_02720 [Rickettsiales bacterium]|jgi:tetratricopeptide (TPR) repeat protein|nr:hypothetical protein [Rickettsiales bacterium]